MDIRSNRRMRFEYTEESADRSAEATREEMSAERVPIQYRDSCAHLLIPLNKCRFQSYYLPWKCQVRYNNSHPGRVQLGK